MRQPMAAVRRVGAVHNMAEVGPLLTEGEWGESEVLRSLSLCCAIVVVDLWRA